MALSDDMRKTLYDAFSAYSKAESRGVASSPTGGREGSGVIGALDGMFNTVVGSMSVEAREKFVSSLQNGSTAMQSIDCLLHEQTEAAATTAAAAAVTAISVEKQRQRTAQKEEAMVEQDVIESEVIKLLQQLPREKVKAEPKVAQPLLGSEEDGEVGSSLRSSITDGESKDVDSDTQPKFKSVGESRSEEMSSIEMCAAQALLQSQRGVGKRPRQYSDPIPSEHCHVCCRPTRKLRFAICSNIKRSLCRKVICVKCFECFEWNWEHASMDDTTWICTHCRDDCPKRAQCFVYERINSRRKKKNRESTERENKP